ncbi:AAA family ATPase [Pantoea sp. FN0305]
MFIKNQRIIITGGPGSGKSKLLRSLSAQGFLTSAEAERAIIWDRTATGGNALSWVDCETCAENMLNWELCSWHAAEGSISP